MIIPGRPLVVLVIGDELQIGLNEGVLQVVKNDGELLSWIPVLYDFREDSFAGQHIDIGMKKSPIVVDARPDGEVGAGNEYFGPEVDALEDAGERLHIELNYETCSLLLDHIPDQESAELIGEVVVDLGQFSLNPYKKRRFLLLLL